MEYRVECEDARMVVGVSGRLDAETAPVLEGGLALDAHPGISEVVFDLGKLEYISSAGLRVLLATYKRVNKHGGTMRVQGATGAVAEVLAMSGFSEIFG